MPSPCSIRPVSTAAHVVGASMGGAISQLMAVRHPTRVLSLTLACTACRNQPWRRELLERWMATAQERGMGAMTSEAARWVIGAALVPPPAAHVRLARAAGDGAPDPRVRRPGARPSWRPPTNSPTNCTSIDVPTLVVVGNQDILTPRGDSEEIAERIPGAELVVISGAAHGFMVEHASTFNKILKEFLHRVSQANARNAAGR